MPQSLPSPIVAEVDAAAASPVGATERLRLLLLTDTSIVAAGGSERFLRNLLSRLPPERYAITVVQLNGSSQAGAIAHPLVGHVLLRTLGVGAVYGLRGWQAQRKLWQLVRRERFHLVQSQHEKSDLFNALLPRRDGMVHVSNRRDMGFNKSARLRLLFRFINHRFDCVVAPARPILSGLVRDERLGIGRMTWIPNGVDADRFAPPSAMARHSSRQALGLDDAALVFGCVASLTPVKRHVDLIEAFASVHAKLPAARLLLIGDGPLRAAIGEQIATLGLQDAVELLGDRSNIETLLPALDVALLTSSTEGMSNAILEAMACGLPVVATSVGGNLQLVEHQVTGLLVPAANPVALAEAMLLLAETPALRHRLGDAARTRIERDFSLDAMAHSYDRLYRRLLGWP
jgi:glycosyltransferase involved in cell wall biosynthesis